MHRVPRPNIDPLKRQQWLAALNLTEEQVLDHHRICSRHFPNGDITQVPSLQLGKSFASPKKIHAPRSIRAHKRANRRTYLDLLGTPPNPKRASRNPSTSTLSEDSDTASQLRTPPGEAYFTDYNIHELPTDESYPDDSGGMSDMPSMDTEVVVNTALVARIETLEAEVCCLRAKVAKNKETPGQHCTF